LSRWSQFGHMHIDTPSASYPTSWALAA